LKISFVFLLHLFLKRTSNQIDSNTNLYSAVYQALENFWGQMSPGFL